METSTTDAIGAAGNTATSVEQDQTLLNPQSAAPVPGTEPATETAAPAEKEKGGDEAPLLSPEGEKPAEKQDAPGGAPETYAEFTVPEGFALEGETLEEATTMFKGLNLSQENAQKLVDYFTKRTVDEKAAGLNELAARRKSWRAEVRQRPDFAAERELAQRGMRAIITDPDEKELFTNSWMSDHPVLWKMFTKIGRLAGEDSLPKGNGGGTPDSNINMMRFPNV